MLGQLSCHALQAWQNKLLEPFMRSVVDVIALTDVLDTNSDVGHGVHSISLHNGGITLRKNRVMPGESCKGIVEPLSK